MPEVLEDDANEPATPAAKTAKTDKNTMPGSSEHVPITLDASSDEECKSAHAFQQQTSRGMSRIKGFNHTINSGATRDLCGKIHALFQLIEPVAPDHPKFNDKFVNVIDKWGSGSCYDQSARVLCEGLHRWMKLTTFIPDRKLLLKIEKRSHGCEKFSGMDAMLFTAASGWILKEFNFILDGADPLEE